MRMCSKTLSMNPAILSRAVVEKVTASCKTLFFMRGSLQSQYILFVELSDEIT
jgi:hypothetical protein